MRCLAWLCGATLLTLGGCRDDQGADPVPPPHALERPAAHTRGLDVSKPATRRAHEVVVQPDGIFVKLAEPRLTLAEESELQRLAALGYATGHEPPSTRSGVTVNAPESLRSGYNLYTSGHAPVATLIDMDGRVQHRWSFEVAGEVSEKQLESRRIRNGTTYMRRAHLYPNGDLLALYDYVGLVKLDRDSNKLWSRIARYHHDLRVLPDGRLLTLDEMPRNAPELGFDREILDNHVVTLDRNGRETEKLSLLDCFRNTFDVDRLQMLFPARTAPDIFHSNSIQLLDGSHAAHSPVFAAGNFLISIRSNNLIAIVDPGASRIAAVLSGPWRGQHEARLEDDGRIVIFDNLGMRDYSRLLAFDIVSHDTLRDYTGTPETSFYSRFQGTHQRLANGNRLVTESMGGRAFEIGADEKIIWEFVSPHRAGDNDELVAVLFDMVRVDVDTASSWLRPASH